MLETIIKPNSYQDSINLMLLTASLSQIDGVNKIQVMMGTDANKNIFKTSGLLTPEAINAQPNDMVIVMDICNSDLIPTVLTAIESFLNDLSVKKSKNQFTDASTWKQALSILPDANIALISVPGIYAAEEIENALDHNLHAFVFSDNVSLEDEKRLKNKAHEKGLLVMGPDCGTGLIDNVPLAFTNAIRSGNIGVIGASGTGIQEVTTLIHRFGGGVMHAIGTGGRDLSESVDGITMKDSILALNQQNNVDVIVVISKPPAPKVRDEIITLLHSIDKKVVTIFVGEKPQYLAQGNVYFASTLEEAAKISVDLAADKEVKIVDSKPVHQADITLNDKHLVGLYSGGTLAYEAGLLIAEAFDLCSHHDEEGYILKSEQIKIIDLGDDVYTQGKPHPMIDPQTRIDQIRQFAAQKETGIILLDVVLGYGAHDDMVSALIPVINESLIKNPQLKFIATVVGTDKDPQNFNKSISMLEQAGVIVESSNTKAVKLALAYMGKLVPARDTTQVVAYEGEKVALEPAADNVLSLLMAKPKVINVGLSSFVTSIKDNGGSCVQYNWKPSAGGNTKLIKIIRKIRQNQEVQNYNQEVITKIKNSSPFLIDVVPAKSVIPELNSKTLLHAGPPIQYHEMTGPMQGSCIGAMLFENWADNEEQARKMLENGEINFIPCHHVKAVGPMGGITSGNMPVLVVENRLGGNQAYCTMNEGIGKVLRFGAYSSEVVNRLIWMRDVLGPTIGAALKISKEGINLNVLIAKAITMGDEFHQRNIAASLLFLKEISPLIIKLDIEQSIKQEVIQFLADTDQFFLNIMMATGKAIVDDARLITEGTVVTTMTRNGKDFGIRVSGLGDEWFTAPVNTPQGLFFTGFTQDDANPDIGDSAITETVGVGAMAMIAAPGVTRFVGAGGFEDALSISNSMAEICLGHNSNFSIPTWDFKGAVLGIDILSVVETGITPLINTGIAHKHAGVGQVGAGTVSAPVACFEKALIAYAKKLGVDENA